MKRRILFAGLLVAALAACSPKAEPQATPPRPSETTTTTTAPRPYAPRACPSDDPELLCSVRTADPKAGTGPRRLLALFEEMEGRATKRVMVGTHVNASTFQRTGRAKVAEANALFGDGEHVALRSYGTGRNDPPSGYLRDMIDHHRAGGVVLLDFSPPNPANGLAIGNLSARADIVSMASVTTPGNELHERYLTSVDTLCRNYLQPLQEAGVTAIVRPLYEANNSGWWYAKNPEGVGNRGRDGTHAASDWTYERFIALYRQTWNRITTTCGAHNVLSAWTMHLGWPLEGAQGVGSMLEMYPGPSDVDIIGGSWYDLTRGDDVIARVQQLRAAIPDHPIGAIETGRSQERGAGKVDLTVWRDVLADLPITSIMFWNNSHDITDQKNGASLLQWDGNMSREDVREALGRS